MIEWYKKVVFENYANFNGRARRSEFWYFILMNWLIVLGIVILTGILSFVSETLGSLGALLYMIYGLALLIPNIAVGVRRLHDVGKSGWLLLIALVPLVGIILIVWWASAGTVGANEYGPDPKGDTINEIGKE